MNLRTLIALWASAALVACQPAPAPRALVDAAAAPRLDESSALCLASSAGQGSVERALRVAQATVAAGAPTARHWVTIGSHWLRKARAASDPGFYLNVNACIDAALAVDADDADALALRSLVLMQDHEFAAARKLAERVLAAEPEHVIALGTLSDAALELGDYQGALRAAQRQMAVRPGMAAEARAAYLAFLHGENARAKALIRDALESRSPADPEAAAWAFVEAAKLFWHEGDLRGADAVAAEALAWLPDHAPALVLRAHIALAMSEPARAITLAARAHELRPLVETAALLSDAHAIAGDVDMAEQWFERACALGEQTDRLGLGQLLARRDRDHARALAALEAERQHRAGIALDDAYAWALYRAGRLQEAEHFSEQALRLGTTDARLLFHAGAIQLALGKTRRGRELLTRALELNAHFDPFEAADARRLLGLGAAVAERG